MAELYHKTIHCGENAARILGSLEKALAKYGFEVLRNGNASLEGRCPGRTNSKNNPPFAADPVRFRRTGDRIERDANFALPLWLKVFLLVFPPSLMAILGALLAVVFTRTMPDSSWQPVLAIVLGANLMLWLCSAPFLHRAFHRSTRESLDRLLITASEESAP